MEDKLFRESVDALKGHSTEEIEKAKSSTLELIGSLYEERAAISDEIKRTVLHFKAADQFRKRKLASINQVLIPRHQLRVQRQINSFFNSGKASSIRQLKKLLKEKEYLEKSRTEHTIRVKQMARRLIAVHGEINKAEKHYEMLRTTDKLKVFLLDYQMPIESIDNYNMDKWKREFVRKGGVERV